MASDLFVTVLLQTIHNCYNYVTLPGIPVTFCYISRKRGPGGHCVGLSPPALQFAKAPESLGSEERPVSTLITPPAPPALLSLLGVAVHGSFPELPHALDRGSIAIGGGADGEGERVPPSLFLSQKIFPAVTANSVYL